MFEFAKRNDRPKTMKYFASLLLSVMVHAMILCVIVTVPMIFCSTMNPGEFITWMIAPPPLPAPISAPAPVKYGNPNAAPGGTGQGTARIPIPVFMVPSGTPDIIDLVSPIGDFLGDGSGNGKDEWGSLSGIKGGVGVPLASSHLKLINEKAVDLKPPEPPKIIPVVTRPVPSDLQASKLIHKVVPLYPPIALRIHLSGTVALMATIDMEGNVADLKVMSGHPVLANAAVEAVKQWKYSPTILNGEPVPVQAVVNVVFALE